MDPIASFSGLASGIDFRSLVDQLILLERRPIDRLQGQIDQINAKVSAFQEFRGLLNTLQARARDFRTGTAFDAVTATANSTSGSNLLVATADPGTTPTAFDVEVLSLATQERLGSSMFASDNTALGLSGEFFINGVRLEVTTVDTLASIRDRINNANAGIGGSGVTASVLATTPTSHRLILTSDTSGAQGIDLIETSGLVLEQLGLVDATTTLKHATSSGGESDRLASSTTAVGSLRGLSTGTGPQTVTIGGQNVAIDLATDSLTDIAAAIDGLAGVTATVESETSSGGSVQYYVDVRGTTSFADAGGTLEVLGFLERGRSAVNQSVQGAELAQNGAGNPAAGNTRLQNLFVGGQDAGVQTGDTFTITGTRGDGTAVALNFTVGGNDRVDDLLDLLNNTTDGFGAGARPATASIGADGRIVLTDSVAGDSQLSLSIVANNEGGGVMDFGNFAIAELGRDREITAGQDASLRVDGVSLTRTSNTITDIVAGVTLTLQNAEVGATSRVTVERNADEAVEAGQAFTDAYNEFVTFVKDNLLVPAGSEERPTLFGDSTLRLTRSSVVEVLLSSVTGAASDLALLSTVGFSIKTSGELTFDATEFTDAFESRFQDFQLLFEENGLASDPEVLFFSPGDVAEPGSYAVEILTPAARAATQSSGFSGVYSDDGTADTFSVTDTASGLIADVQLTNGMTTQQIVDALNSAFQSQDRTVATANSLFSDGGGTTAMTAATTFDSLFAAGGAPANVTAGDTIAYSGTRRDGTSFSGTFTVTDPATTTVGALTTVLDQAYGTGVDVRVSGGTIEVTDTIGGGSSLDLTLTANNEGGGSLDFGATTVGSAGRSAMAVTAQAVGNDIDLTHSTYGLDHGFTVTLTGGGANNTGQLGVTAGAYTGQDVAGTIGGFAATGTGQQLIGDDGTAVEGLHITYTGSTARNAGAVTLTLGAGARLERLLEPLLEAGSGTLAVKEQGFNDRVTRLEDRIDVIEARLDRRRVALLRQFASMEVLIGQFQALSGTLNSQIGSLIGQSGGLG